MSLFLLPPALFFLLLGLRALARPADLLAGFDLAAASAASRNEVRAVYGGFPLFIGAALLLPFAFPALTAGVAAAGTLALAGMAAGRLVSAAIDGEIGRLPLFFTGVEIVGAAMLGAAWAGAV